MSSSGGDEVDMLGSDIVDTSEDLLKDEPTETYEGATSEKTPESFLGSSRRLVNKEAIEVGLDRIDMLIANRRKELEERTKIVRQFMDTSDEMRIGFAARAAATDACEETHNPTVWIYRISIVVLLLVALYNYFIDFRPYFVDEYRFTS